jgi:hypothetical protein
MTLDELAGFHEKQAANFEPFGASNAVTVFHRDAASLIRMKLCAVDSLRSVLRVIVEQDPVELALDPNWSQRIAKGGLDATRAL